MFKIPAIPSASYFADGLVTTSTLSIILAGILFKPPVKPEGRPSIKMRTFSEPRKATFPSISTVTEGTLFKISSAEPPVFAKSFPTLKTFLSKVKTTLLFSARTSTSPNISESVVS